MIGHRALLGIATAVLLSPSALCAQTVLVRLTDSATSRPVVGALVHLVGDGGQNEKSALSDDRGRVLFVGIPAGRYHASAEMIGMATSDTEAFDISEGVTRTYEIRFEASAIQLEGIEVELDGRCEVRPGGEGLLVAEVWNEARKALSAAAFTDRVGTYRYETMTYERSLDRDTKVILSEEQDERTGYMRTPFESRPAEDLIENGFVQADGAERLYFAPDANVLLSDAFLDTHCFRLVDGGRGPEELIGLGFEPTGENRRVVDISGALWLDRRSAELRWLEFRYRYLDPDISTADVGGRVEFQRMPNGTWIVPEWWIRMPVVSVRTDFQGSRSQFIVRYHQKGGRVMEARESSGRRLGGGVTTGGVEGVVTDSLGLPLRGARVGIVGSNQEVFSDAEGHFSITGLGEGLHQVRVVAPRLADLGYVSEPVTGNVTRGELTQVDFRMPSLGDVLFEACRGVTDRQGLVMLAGLVRDAGGLVTPNATVRVRWTTFDVHRGLGIQQRPLGTETTTDAKGFYRFCGVPDDRTLEVTASLGTLESEPVELWISIEEGAQVAVLRLPAGQY
ncbi:MAG: carboxypeptidase-like regulatory domain-containing protein [Gemmatimonadetes bacterium]|nr:carboxypeptidase-like regulatory domain-containing protein [Gemmatimonadota bacterium]MDA1102645.1 carboxypeptidase-like regulatory domain-containing protein [Gemmatimonadota bacterium]